MNKQLSKNKQFIKFTLLIQNVTFVTCISFDSNHRTLHYCIRFNYFYHFIMLMIMISKQKYLGFHLDLVHRNVFSEMSSILSVVIFNIFYSEQFKIS